MIHGQLARVLNTLSHTKILYPGRTTPTGMTFMMSQSRSALKLCTFGYIFFGGFSTYLAAVPPFALEAQIHEAQKAALSSLSTFQELNGPNKLNALAFGSPGAAATATLGAPLPVTFVRLDELSSYKTEADPNSLISAPGGILFPVSTKGSVSSSILMHQVEGAWRPAKF